MGAFRSFPTENRRMLDPIVMSWPGPRGQRLGFNQASTCQNDACGLHCVKIHAATLVGKYTFTRTPMFVQSPILRGTLIIPDAGCALRARGEGHSQTGSRSSKSRTKYSE